MEDCVYPTWWKNLEADMNVSEQSLSSEKRR